MERWRWQGMKWDIYVENCRRLAVGLSGTLPVNVVDNAVHLIEHGQVIEGLILLSESIVSLQIEVSASVISALYELTDGLLTDGLQLPPALAEFGR